MMKQQKTLVYLIVLLSLLTLGLVVSNVFNRVFDSFEAELTQSIKNNYAKTEIGSGVFNNLLKIHVEISELLKSRSEHAIDMHCQKIDMLILQINSSLNVLESGGIVNTNFKVNTEIYSHCDKIIKKLSYTPDNTRQYIQPIIDLRPKLQVLSEKVNKIKQIMVKKLSETQANNPSPQLLSSISISSKSIIPLLKRMREHANQILLEGETASMLNTQRTIELKNFYSNIETFLTVFAIIILLFFGIIISKHIINDNKKLLAASENINVILQALPVAIMLVDDEMLIRGINSETKSILRAKSDDDLLGKNYWEIMKRTQNKKKSTNALSDDTKSFSENLTIKTLNDIEITIFKTSIPLEINGNQMMLESFMDISEMKRTEAALEENMNFIHTVFNTVSTGIVVIDETTHEILDANESALKMFETSKKEAIGNMCHKSICPAEKDNCLISDYGQIVDSSEKTLQTTKGNTIEILKTVSKASLNGRKCLVESFMNISLLKKVQQRIKEESENFQNVFYNSYDAVLLIDGSMFVDCNDATVKMLNAKDKNQIFKTHPSKISPKQQPDGELSETKANIMIKKAFDNGFNRFEWIHKKFSGETFPVEVNLTKIIKNGKAILHCLWKDISVEKKMLKQQKEAAQRWQQTFDAMRDMIAVIDKDMKIVSCNNAMKKAFPEVAEGKTHCHTIIHGLCSPLEGCVAQQTFKNGRIATAEIFEEHIGGRWIDARTFPVINNNGEVTQVIHTFRDITELKQYEQDIISAKESAEAANNAKSSFLSMMSHEIRTPMNGVIGITELLAETKLNDMQRDYVNTIQLSGDALLTVINDILDYSKIESGKLKLEERPFELIKIIEDAMDLMNINAVSQKIGLFNYVASETPAFIYGDSVRLRQILINLIGNALKFTTEGEVVISLKPQGSSNGTKPEDNVQLQFSVKDTGIGISEEGRTLLFQDFSQVDPSTTRKYGGTGLGLAICKRLTNMMGGKIWVESKLGEGSTFFFTITTKIAPAQQREYLKHHIPELRGLSILIVDDNKTNRTILETQTMNWGMKPYLAESAEKALGALQEKNRFDLAILDMHMPNMNGVELASEIRRKYPNMNLPLIMLSSAGEITKNKIKTNLFAAFLNKPAKQSSLFNSLITVCNETAKPHSETIREKQVDDKSLPFPVTFAHCKVLVAEDNSVNRTLAAKLFEKMGILAKFAENGKIAVEMFKKEPFDLIFMDCQMPEMDGYNATENIRTSKSKNRSIPIIAMTANAMEGDREKCLKAGMSDYLSKPIKKQMLIDIIAKWI